MGHREHGGRGGGEKRRERRRRREEAEERLGQAIATRREEARRWRRWGRMGAVVRDAGDGTYDVTFTVSELMVGDVMRINQSIGAILFRA